MIYQGVNYFFKIFIKILIVMNFILQYLVCIQFVREDSKQNDKETENLYLLRLIYYVNNSVLT